MMIMLHKFSRQDEDDKNNFIESERLFRRENKKSVQINCIVLYIWVFGANVLEIHLNIASNGSQKLLLCAGARPAGHCLELHTDLKVWGWLSDI